jgi:bifunctional UDP-N-acetylglucosamine pyrophosphorylase/glucosamine-1-phosphate N-acetyltransferase
MKALVLTAGMGNRLRPLTANRSKSMLMIAGKPVLQYIIDSLKENDIRDITLVVGHGKQELMNYMQQGTDEDISIRYVHQLEQKGVEHAILCAKDELADEEEFLVVHGDVLVEPEMVSRALNNHSTQDAYMTYLVTLVSNPEQFGTVKIGRNGTVERLVEKGGPNRYVSNYAVAGLTIFNREIFSLLAKHTTMERAIETVINGGKKVSAAVWEKEWAEFTWPWDILKANRIVMDRKLKGHGTFIAESAEIHKNVVLEGPVFIDEGTIIRPGTTVCGPVYIGKRVYVGNNSLVRDYASLCDGVHLGYAVEVRNSMVFERVNIGRMTCLADSIVGADACIEAGVQLWNWRPGNQPLYLHSPEETVRVPLSKFGAIIGDGVIIGVNTSIYPATRIGENSVIAAGCIIDQDIPPDSEVRVQQNLSITKRSESEKCC